MPLVGICAGGIGRLVSLPRPDLSGYFDSLPHAELLKSVARRVVDGAMLHLIRMWLEAPVEETDAGGRSIGVAQL